MKTIKFFIIGLILMNLTSCATIFCGSKQRIAFNSNPASASIFIDGKEIGKTPLEAKLKRNQEHRVLIKLEGYKDYQMMLTRKFNYVYLGNILIGGLTGIIVDTATGAMYRFSVKEINAQMDPSIVRNEVENGLYIGVAMQVDPSWEKVGQMEKN